MRTLLSSFMAALFSAAVFISSTASAHNSCDNQNTAESMTAGQAWDNNGYDD